MKLPQNMDDWQEPTAKHDYHMFWMRKAAKKVLVLES